MSKDIQKTEKEITDLFSRMDNPNSCQIGKQTLLNQARELTKESEQLQKKYNQIILDYQTAYSLQ